MPNASAIKLTYTHCTKERHTDRIYQKRYKCELFVRNVHTSRNVTHSPRMSSYVKSTNYKSISQTRISPRKISRKIRRSCIRTGMLKDIELQCLQFDAAPYLACINFYWRQLNRSAARTYVARFHWCNFEIGAFIVWRWESF